MKIYVDEVACDCIKMKKVAAPESPVAQSLRLHFDIYQLFQINTNPRLHVDSFEAQNGSVIHPLIPKTNKANHILPYFPVFHHCWVKNIEPFPASATWAVPYSRILMEAIFSGINCKISMLMSYYYTVKYICPRSPLCSQWHDGNISCVEHEMEQYIILDNNEFEDYE